MSLYHAKSSFEPPLTTQERKQHWGIPSQAEGPIARPLVDGLETPLLPVLAKNLRAEMATRETTAAIAPVVELDYAFRFGYEHRGHRLRARVVWDFSAYLFGKFSAWSKEVFARLIGRTSEGLGIGNEVKYKKFLTNADQDAPRKYWEQRARFFGAGL